MTRLVAKPMLWILYRKTSKLTGYWMQTSHLRKENMLPGFCSQHIYFGHVWARNHRVTDAPEEKPPNWFHLLSKQRNARALLVVKMWPASMQRCEFLGPMKNQPWMNHGSTMDQPREWVGVWTLQSVAMILGQVLYRCLLHGFAKVRFSKVGHHFYCFFWMYQRCAADMGIARLSPKR